MRLQVGTVVTDQRLENVLAIGYNGNARGLPNKCDSAVPGNCGCIHSEMNALVKAPGSVRDKVVFVSASPCVMCAKLIINSGVTHVFYRKAYRDPSGSKCLRQGGVMPVLYDRWMQRVESGARGLGARAGACMAMDELDRLFGLLVEALARETRIGSLRRSPPPEVYERLVPYRSNRSRLNVATHQDYEMAVLRLLAGERGLRAARARERARGACSARSPRSIPIPRISAASPTLLVMVNRIAAAERVLLADRAYAARTQCGGWTKKTSCSDATGERSGADAVRPGAAFRCRAARMSRRRRPAMRVLWRHAAPSSRESQFLPALRPAAGARRAEAASGCGSEVDVGLGVLRERAGARTGLNKVGQLTVRPV